jgi:hypothetical protein
MERWWAGEERRRGMGELLRGRGWGERRNG